MLIIKLRNTHASIIQPLQALVNASSSSADSIIIHTRTGLEFLSLCMYKERKIKCVGGRVMGDGVSHPKVTAKCLERQLGIYSARGTHE